MDFLIMQSEFNFFFVVYNFFPSSSSISFHSNDYKLYEMLTNWIIHIRVDLDYGAEFDELIDELSPLPNYHIDWIQYILYVN